MKNKKIKFILKRFLIVFLILTFAFSILLVSIFKASSSTLATLKPSLDFEFSSSPTATPTTKTEVQYYLPYPGILPDHFLYPLKMVRDRIWLWLTTNSLKKVEVLLLFADKRLGAGKFLIEGNKIGYGITTLEKAEKYLERAVFQLEEAKKKGFQVEEVAQKLRNASDKHKEVLENLAQGLSGQVKELIERLYFYPVEVSQKIDEILR